MSTIHKGMSIENEQKTKATDLKPEIYPLKMTDYHKNRFSARQCKKWTVSRQIFFTANVSSGLPRPAAKSAVKSRCGSAVLTLASRFHPGYKLVGHIRRSVQVFWRIRPPPPRRRRGSRVNSQCSLEDDMKRGQETGRKIKKEER
jgi:hypothetical protein